MLDVWVNLIPELTKTGFVVHSPSFSLQTLTSVDDWIVFLRALCICQQIYQYHDTRPVFYSDVYIILVFLFILTCTNRLDFSLSISLFSCYILYLIWKKKLSKSKFDLCFMFVSHNFKYNLTLLVVPVIEITKYLKSFTPWVWNQRYFNKIKYAV